VSRRATLAIWAACLAGGVGIGALTDGGTVPPARPDRAEPASEGTNVDAAGWRPSGADKTLGRAGPSRRAADASVAAVDEDEAEAAVGRSDPPTNGAGRRSPHRSRAGGSDGRDASSIIETIVPGIVIPPLDGQPGEPGESTTTTTEPSSTTTTSEPPSSTTTTMSSIPPVPGGGSGPVVSPLRPGRGP
jgi:hypothetical protein